MSKIISYIAVISVLLAFSCKSPEENPDLRVINGFTDSKLVYLAVNGQVFVDSTTPLFFQETLLPILKYGQAVLY